MFAVAQTPPRSSHAITSGRNVGLVAISNPPYPYSIARLRPSCFIPFLCVMNIGTRVPSFDQKNTRSVPYWDGSKVSFAGSNGALVPVAASNRNTVPG